MFLNNIIYPDLSAPHHIPVQEAVLAEEGRGILIHHAPHYVEHYVKYIEAVWNGANNSVILPEHPFSQPWQANLDSFTLYRNMVAISTFETNIIEPILALRPTVFDDDNREVMLSTYQNILMDVDQSLFTPKHHKTMVDMIWILENNPRSFRDYVQFIKPLNLLHEVDEDIPHATKFLLRMDRFTEERDACYLDELGDMGHDFVHDLDNYHLSHFCDFHLQNVYMSDQEQYGILPPLFYQHYQEYVLNASLNMLGTSPPLDMILNVFQEYRDTHVYDKILEIAHNTPHLQTPRNIYIFNQLDQSRRDNQDWTYLYAACVDCKLDSKTANCVIGYDLFLEHKKAIEARIEFQHNNPAFAELTGERYAGSDHRALVNKLNDFLSDSMVEQLTESERDLFTNVLKSYNSSDKTVFNDFVEDIVYEPISSTKIRDFTYYIDESKIYGDIMEQKFGKPAILRYLETKWLSNRQDSICLD
jgi:hypothetical protein